MNSLFWSLCNLPFFFLLGFEGYFGLKSPLKYKIGTECTKRGANVLFTKCLDSADGSKACAEQNGGKRESHRLQGFRPGRKRPQGPLPSFMLACGKPKSLKARTFPKANSYWVARQAHSFMWHSSCPCPRDFHMLGDSPRANRYKAVPAAHPTLQKEGGGWKEEWCVSGSPCLHQPKSTYPLPWQRQASKEGKYCLLLVASHWVWLVTELMPQIDLIWFDH